MQNVQYRGAVLSIIPLSYSYRAETPNALCKITLKITFIEFTFVYLCVNVYLLLCC
jgi:hypothetical protein